MWYIYYFSSFFDNRYVRCPFVPAFKSNIDALRVAAKMRAEVDLSYVVLPY